MMTPNFPDYGVDALTIHGGWRLSGGSVSVPGFKHALVTAVAAAATADASLSLRGCPDIAETAVLARLLDQLGATVERTGHTLIVDGRGIGAAPNPSPTMSTADITRIHGSVYLLPALLGRFGVVSVAEVGGCRIGDEAGGGRPMSHYVEVFERFGATSHDTNSGLQVRADQLRGASLDLAEFMTDRRLRTGPLYSGATKTALLTAAMARGTSEILTPYPKPDVTELVRTLRALGANVLVLEDRYVVEGADGTLPGPNADLELVPDLIALITWICVGAVLCEAPLTVTAPRMAAAQAALAPELEVLQSLGVRVDWAPASCTVHPARDLRPVDVVAASHGVFSDNQPFLALIAATACGVSTVQDKVWSSRFTYASGFAALGMDVAVDGDSMIVRGPWHPRATDSAIEALDLRAAAALLLAAIATPGRTQVTGLSHLARGYADLPGDLARLGARLERIGS